MVSTKAWYLQPCHLQARRRENALPGTDQALGKSNTSSQGSWACSTASKSHSKFRLPWCVRYATLTATAAIWGKEQEWRMRRGKNCLGFASSYLQVMARQYLCQPASALHVGFAVVCFLKYWQTRLLIIISWWEIEASDRQERGQRDGEGKGSKETTDKSSSPKSAAVSLAHWSFN